VVWRRRGFLTDNDIFAETAVTGFTLNGEPVEVDSPPETPLLWVVRDHLKLSGTKFGCLRGLCGACTVHVDGEAVRSCQTFLGDLGGADVTTIEGLSTNREHPLQKAWIAEQVAQCGYCQSGQIMQAATLLEANPSPSRDEIIQHMNGNLCRCGTYLRIIRAIELAASEV
jgi:isoquinoline 1-oxidoreductase alpha subunit